MKIFKFLSYPGLLLAMILLHPAFAEKTTEEKTVNPPVPDTEQKFTVTEEKIEKPKVRILFAGDTHFIWGIKDLQERYGFFAPVAKILPVFKENDFSVLNLETTITHNENPLNGKVYVFNSDEENLKILRKMNLGLAILGNNHTMDMGDVGLKDTMVKLNRGGIPSIGAGMNMEDATSPYFQEIEGIKFAFVSFSDVGFREMFSRNGSPGVAPLYMATRVIRLIKNKVDHVIVNIHWGKEYRSMPEKDQIRVARSLITNGASAIIGHHPHVPQGMEFYRNGVIFYSLGNFIFGSVNQQQVDNMVVQLLFHQDSKKLSGVRIIPITGRYERYGHAIRPLNYKESLAFWREFMVQSTALSGNYLKQLEVQKDGSGQIIIEQD